MLEDGLTKSSSLNEDGYTNYGSAEEGIDPSLDPGNDEYWIRRARSSYQSSQTWFDTSVRRRMEDNMRLFNSDHPRGSRYREAQYSKRSKLFRPKTRSSVRKMEASAAAAFFATQDAVSCSPPNSRDKEQRLAADSQSELLNYRLSSYIPWYLTCLGGLQDAAKQGVVISKQVWVYREVEDAYEDTIVDDVTGAELGTRMTYERRTVADHPDIQLRPVENVRFSPAADWRNPLQTSPFLIDLEPFFVGDMLDKMNEGSQGPYDAQWRKLDKATIRSALRQSYDPVRQAREGHREDRYEENYTDIDEHEVVWVHHNYMRLNGQDWYYATIGTEVMLTDVVPLDEVTPLKERPYVMGICAIETHKPYPSGLVDLSKPLQEEINDLTNLRIDNIRHIISPRYFIKRGTSVDVRSLLRNVAGGVTAMEDPQNDVNIRTIADSTSSSFQEHDRLAIENDELIGTFSQSTVANNQNINERVGNTMMLGESANQVTEMTIRTFAETWVEPVLQQVMELERSLESDVVVLSVVGQRMGVPAEEVFRMMELPVKVTVNVGFGATNPQMRLQKVALGFQTLAQINPEWIMQADQLEVVTEVLGAVGYKSAERFFPQLAEGAEEGVDPQLQQLQQENEQLKAMVDGKSQELEFKGKIEEQKIQSKERMEMAKLQYQQGKDRSLAEIAQAVEENKWKMKLLDYQINLEKNQMTKHEMIQQRIALNHTITMDERQYEMTREQMEMQGYDLGDELEYTDYAGGQPQVRRESGAERPEPTNIPIPDTQVHGSGKDIASIRSDPSGEMFPPPGAMNGEPRIASLPHIGTEDSAGVIARDQYGAVPFEEG
jgi:hypothetical protein